MSRLHYLIIAVFLSFHVSADEPPTFPITDFGAISNDGKTLNTSAIAKAIDAAFKAGGGVVKVPGGKWLTGAVELKSRVTLFLDNGANLLMSTNPADYPVVLTRWEGIECYNYSGLIYAINADHIAITGKGTIDGQGQSWWRWYKSAGPAQRKLRELGETTTDPAKRVFGTPKDSLRPSLIQFIHCEDVLLESVNLKNSPMWTVHPIYCERVLCKDLYIFGQGPNTDGIDPDSCKKVRIENCTLDCGDDCIAIKSGRDADGRRVDIASEQIEIRDCHMQRGHAGIAIGSEMAGGVHDVKATHNFMRGTTRGIRFKTMRGRGGIVENITLADLKMTDILQTDIEIDMQYNLTDPRPFDQGTPVFKNISIRDLTCDNAKQAMMLRGLSESAIQNLTIKNTKFKCEKGILAEHLINAKLENIEVNLTKPATLVRGEFVVDFTLDRLKTPRAPHTGPLLLFKSAPNLTIKNTDAPSRTDLFLQLGGPETKGWKLENCDTSKAKQRVEAGEDVPKEAADE